MEKFETGQRVIIYGYGNERVATIDRVTPSGQAIIGKERFGKDGYRIPKEKWNNAWIKPCADEECERIKEESFVRGVKNKMLNTDWSSVIKDYKTAVKFAEFMGWKK